MDDHQLDHLLSATRNSEPTPSALIDRVQARIVRRQLARRTVAGTALLGALASGVALLTTLGPSGPSRPRTGDPIEPQLAGPARPAEVELDSAYMTQHLASSHPNVTIVRVYQRHVEPEPQSEVDPGATAPALPDPPQSPQPRSSSHVPADASQDHRGHERARLHRLAGPRAADSHRVPA